MDVVDKLYGGYGDMQEMGGHGPRRARSRREGNAYLDKELLAAGQDQDRKDPSIARSGRECTRINANRIRVHVTFIRGYYPIESTSKNRTSCPWRRLDSSEIELRPRPMLRLEIEKPIGGFVRRNQLGRKARPSISQALSGFLCFD